MAVEVRHKETQETHWYDIESFMKHLSPNCGAKYNESEYAIFMNQGERCNYGITMSQQEAQKLIELQPNKINVFRFPRCNILIRDGDALELKTGALKDRIVSVDSSLPITDEKRAKAYLSLTTGVSDSYPRCLTSFIVDTVVEIQQSQEKPENWKLTFVKDNLEQVSRIFDASLCTLATDAPPYRHRLTAQDMQLAVYEQMLKKPTTRDSETQTIAAEHSDDISGIASSLRGHVVSANHQPLAPAKDEAKKPIQVGRAYD